MRKIKRIVLTTLPVLCSTAAMWAQTTFTSGNLTYTVTNATNKYVSVAKGSTAPTGVLTIPSSVTHDNMTYTVTSIGSYAFYNCRGLTSVTIPNSVTEIGNDAFSSCSGLTEITIPNSVTEIGSSAFYNCSSLIYNNEYDNAYYLGNASNPYLLLIKAKSTDITSCEINNECKFIYSYAFKDCSGLMSITIPETVTDIGWGAFCGCSGLTSVTIPESVTSIGSMAFYNCSRLTSITIPNSVTSIGGSAFSECSRLIYNEYDNAYYLGNASNPYLLLIKAKSTSITSCSINTKCKIITNNAFSNRYSSGLTSVTIPNSVTEIGQGAFYGCNSLVYNEYDNAYYLGNTSNPYLWLIKTKSTDITSCKTNGKMQVYL